MASALAINAILATSNLSVGDGVMANWREPKRCDRCNLMFSPDRWSQKYCIPCKAMCAVEGCFKPMKASGLCGAHIHRLKRHGSVGGAVLRPARGDQANRAPSQTSVKLCCEVCSKDFWCPPSLAYRDGQIIRRFCSNECARSIKDTKPTFECACCGKVTVRSKNASSQHYNYKQRFCSRYCADSVKRKGGTIDKNGYRILSINGKDIPEHRYVVEQAIGRPLLPEETVHHISPKPGTKLDNRYPENLEIWSGRHGKGHRARDHVAFALETLKLYPELVSEQGYRLLALESAASTEILGKPSFKDFDAAQVIRGFMSMGV